MSRFMPHHKDKNADTVLAAGEYWRDNCLLQSGSIFGATGLWSEKNLNENFLSKFSDAVMNLEAPRGHFSDKLLFQLKAIEATPEIYQLIAESLWVMYLPCSGKLISPGVKKSTIRKLWDASGKTLSNEHYLQDEYMHGFAHPGTAFNLKIWIELLTFLLFVLEVKTWSDADRVSFLKNDNGTKIARAWDDWPQQWGERFKFLPASQTKNRQIRHMLLHLLFPDSFERAFSGGDKRSIVRTFSDLRPRDMTWSEIDATIRSVRKEQEDHFGTTEIDFFAQPLDTEWKQRVAQQRERVQRKREERRERRKNKRKGGGASPPSPAVAMNIPLNQIFYGPPGTGKTYHTVNAALSILDNKFYQEHSDDRVVLKDRFDKLKKEKRIGVVTFHQSFGYEEFVEGIRPMMEEGEHETVAYEIKSGIFKDMCEQAQSTKPSLQFDEAIEQLKKACTDNLISLVTVTGKKFTITYRGGQTFRFKPDATKEEIDYPVNIEHIKKVYMGANPNDFYNVPYMLPIIEHAQSNYQIDKKTSVVGDGSLRETPGAMLPHVLIIDEINRGNISRIFGELITLIEESKRIGNEEATSVELPYSHKPFGVPNNLYIIGTMNTADRSIALLDTALRRRFRFVEMMPNSKLLADIKLENIDIAKLLTEMNARIEAVYDRDHQIGHSYFMRLKKSPNIETLADIFQHEVLPLLQEYFYDDWEKIDLVLNKNGFLSQKKPPQMSGDAVVEDKKIWLIDPGALRVSANYQKIYADAADDNAA